MIDFARLEEIRALAASYGATLVAATKTQPADILKELHAAAPEAIMGENRVQELLDKYSPDYEWHMIGRLQTNKVKYICGKVSIIHSLDRLDLACEIEKQAAKLGNIQNVLVEINVGEEATKGGVEPTQAQQFISSLAGFEHVRILGLMSVMPRLDDADKLQALYRKLRALFDDLKTARQSNLQMKYLSAGMSDDYKIALDNGANMLRIGRAIFGERGLNAQKV